MSEPNLKRSLDGQAAPLKQAAAPPKPVPKSRAAAKGSGPTRRPEPKPEPEPGGRSEPEPGRAGRVPAAEELLELPGELSLEGVDAGRLAAIVPAYVKQIYSDFRQAHREAFAALVAALARDADAAALRAAYIERVCAGWLRFSSEISLGPREADEPVMPGANRIGGADAIAWRRAHVGFVEIELDFPEEVNGMAGVTIGKVSVASGPGVARILRQSGRRLGELPVYRRLWLGSHRLERAPEVVIGPDHRLEVNAGSSLLAAIAIGARGRLDAVAGEGRGEEAERVRLLDKRTRSAAAAAAAREPGPLGGVVADYPMPMSGDRTAEDERRLGELDRRRHLRAVAARRGAAALWSWVGAVTTDKIHE